MAGSLTPGGPSKGHYSPCSSPDAVRTLSFHRAEAPGKDVVSEGTCLLGLKVLVSKSVFLFSCEYDLRFLNLLCENCFLPLRLGPTCCFILIASVASFLPVFRIESIWIKPIIRI